MLMRTCQHCGNLYPYCNSSYCDKCREIVEVQRGVDTRASRRAANRRYNRGRDTRLTRFYNSAAWRTLSAKYTQDHSYRCEQCGAIATEVHHVVPISTDSGWTKRLDYNGLELLCVRCHNQRHNRFQPNSDLRGTKK